MKRLTEKQQKFAELVANGETQVEAYRKAGYSCEGWPKRNIEIKASELKRKPWMEDEIKRLSPPKPLPKFSHIAPAKEIMALYTQIMRDPTATAKEKMEAAKALTQLRGEIGNVEDEERSKEFMHLVPGSWAMSQYINMALQARVKRMEQEYAGAVEQD